MLAAVAVVAALARWVGEGMGRRSGAPAGPPPAIALPPEGSTAFVVATSPPPPGKVSASFPGRGAGSSALGGSPSTWSGEAGAPRSIERDGAGHLREARFEPSAPPPPGSGGDRPGDDRELRRKRVLASARGIVASLSGDLLGRPAAALASAEFEAGLISSQVSFRQVFGGLPVEPPAAVVIRFDAHGEPAALSSTVHAGWGAGSGRAAPAGDEQVARARELIRAQAAVAGRGAERISGGRGVYYAPARVAALEFWVGPDQVLVDARAGETPRVLAWRSRASR